MAVVVARGEILMCRVLRGIFLTCLFDSVYERGRLLVLMGGWMQMVVKVVGSYRILVELLDRNIRNR